MSNVEVKVEAQGPELIIRTGEANPIYDYQGFKYVVENSQSFIDMLRRKGNEQKTIIAYNTAEVQAIIDDTVVDRDQDMVTYKFVPSDIINEWLQVFGRPLDQKNFLDFLKRRSPGEIPNLEELIAAAQQFRYVTNITGDFTFDDRNNYTFSIKVGEADGTVKLPQTITLYESILQGGKQILMDVELQVIKPKSEADKPTFLFDCPKYQRYWREAVEHEVTRIKQELAGFPIVAGTL